MSRTRRERSGTQRRVVALVLLVVVGLTGSPGRGTAQALTPPATGTVDTVAGGGVGDGGPALEAPLNDPTAVALMADGSLLVADPGNNRIRRVQVDGVISTFAGDGGAGFAGDGGPATAARLDQPTGVSVAPDGDVYIADTLNDRIRRVTPDGTIATVAGTGSAGFSGDGGTATAAALSNPFSVSAVAGPDGTSLVVADSGNDRVRRVAPDGTITTIAGGASPSGPVGDGGPATAARLRLPAATAVDSHGDVFVTDLGDSRLRRIGTDGTITTVAGTGVAGHSGDGGPADQAQIGNPWGVALSEDGDGNVTAYVSDMANADVRAVAPDGTISTVTGTGVPGSAGDGGPATAAQLSSPRGLATGADGSLYIADGGADLVRLVARGLITTLAGNGRPSFYGDGGPARAAALNHPQDVATDAAGDLIVADTNNNQIREVAPDGTITTVAGSGLRGFSGDGGPAVQASFDRPSSVAVGPAGDLYITDVNNQRVRRVDTGGTITTIAGTGTPASTGDGGPAAAASLDAPFGVAVDAAGNVYVAEFGGGRIRRIATDGTISTVAGGGAGFGDGGPATGALLAFPTAVAVGASGDIVVSDTGHNLVRRVSPDGIIRSVAGTGVRGFSGDGGPATAAALASPGAVEVDRWGDIYVADTGNQRIREVTTTGTITTVAGTSDGLGGDGGPATAASFSTPSGLAIGPADVLYVADNGNSRVRAVGLATVSPPTARYVQAAYTDFLGASPDAGQMEGAVVALDAGLRSRVDFVGVLASGDAWIGHLVERFYSDTLGRAPDAGGLAYWTDQLATGRLGVAQVAAQFYASPEYFQRIGQGVLSTWVTDLYAKLLHRAPDPAGLRYWVEVAAGRGRSAVAFAMYQSRESAADRIATLYQSLLGRAPDPGGVAYWTAPVLERGDIALAAFLASSAEYFSRAQARFPL